MRARACGAHSRVEGTKVIVPYAPLALVKAPGVPHVLDALIMAGKYVAVFRFLLAAVNHPSTSLHHVTLLWPRPAYISLHSPVRS